jgi:hypothetical protein
MTTAPTASEWGARTEQIRGQIAEQKYLQTERELTREKQRMKLQDIADKVLGVEIARAEIGLESKKLALQGDKVQLQGAKDNLRYLTAKQTLQQRLWATELMSLEVNLSGSEAKLGELRNVAKTLSHQIKSYVPKNIFGGATDGTSKID